MKEALEVVKLHNLCTYYLLPLIGINKYSFGLSINFRNCYVNPEGTELYVKVYYLLFSLKNHPALLRCEGDAHPVYVFALPENWQYDFECYKAGKYSKFSKEAKGLIQSNSGLRYRALNPNGNPTTDLRLLAIDEDESRRRILRNKLSEYFGVRIEEDAELLSPPPESSFTIIRSLTA